MAAYPVPHFGSCFHKFYNIGHDYPAGGTDGEYQQLVCLDIALHDVREIYKTITYHMQQYEHLDTATKKSIRDNCWTAALQAWNASGHLSPDGGVSAPTTNKALSEMRMDSRLPAVRTTIINGIINRNVANFPLPPGTIQQTFTPISMIPRWYRAVHPVWALSVDPPARPPPQMIFAPGANPAAFAAAHMAHYLHFNRTQLGEFVDEMNKRYESGELLW